MANVQVKLNGNLGQTWTDACRQAVRDLNTLFGHKGVSVTLALAAGGPVIEMKTDPSIAGTALHGEATTETTVSGRLIKSTVNLPVRIQINTPHGMRAAGSGIYVVVAAHEIVHSLGHSDHNSHLMAQVMTKVMGNSAAGDRLQAGAVMMPPLQLSDDSVRILKGLWP